MTVDFREVNKHTAPLAAAVPDTVTLIKEVQKHPGTWYAVINLTSAFLFFIFTIPIAEKHLLSQGWLQSPTICYRIVAEHLDKIQLPSHTQLSHYIDGILI